MLMTDVGAYIHEHKVTNITMSPTSLSPTKVLSYAFFIFVFKTAQVGRDQFFGHIKCILEDQFFGHIKYILEFFKTIIGIRTKNLIRWAQNLNTNFFLGMVYTLVTLAQYVLYNILFLIPHCTFLKQILSCLFTVSFLFTVRCLQQYCMFEKYRFIRRFILATIFRI